jgi:uncharacterized protein
MTEAKNRILGFDFARSLAFLGMVIVNYKTTMSTNYLETNWLSFLTFPLDGRAAATFVVLAGIGLSLMSQNSKDLVKTRSLLLKRALFLFIFGLFFAVDWPADILHFYGVYLLIAAFCIKLPNRSFIIASVISIILFPLLLLILDYESNWDWLTLTYNGFWTLSGFFKNLFFNGFHPVFPWISYIFVGMWLGRQNFKDYKFRKRLLIIGLSSYLFIEIISVTLIIIFKNSNPSNEELDLFKTIFGTEMLPPLPFYMISGIAASFITISLSVSLTERFRKAKWIQPFVSTGQLALSNYVGHILLGFGIISIFGSIEDRSIEFSIFAAIIFNIFAIIFSFIWRKRFKRGPLEWFMRKLTG